MASWASTYSADTPLVTRVLFPTRGPLPNPFPSLHPVLSCLISILSYPVNACNGQKYNYKNVYKLTLTNLDCYSQ